MDVNTLEVGENCKGLIIEVPRNNLSISKYRDKIERYSVAFKEFEKITGVPCMLSGEAIKVHVLEETTQKEQH